jgi:ferredoxin
MNKQFVEMYWVHFQPSDVKIAVPAGMLIREAAILAGVDDIELRCDGRGSCSLCFIGVADRVVSACRTAVRSNIVVRVPQD